MKNKIIITLIIVLAVALFAFVCWSIYKDPSLLKTIRTMPILL